MCPAARRGGRQVTFNSVLIAHAMRRRWRDGLTAFEEMQRMHVRPDVLTYNALITALANGREYDRALQVGFLPPLL